MTAMLKHLLHKHLLQIRLLGWTLAALALGAVFAAYLNPHLAVDLAVRFWACF